MLKDLIYQARVHKDYGLTIPYEAQQAPTSDPQAAPTIQPMHTTQPLPPIEDFAPEDFMPNIALPRSTDCETLTGQDALEAWAAQTAAIRQGKTIPAIHWNSNATSRETQLQDVRCPHCGLEFAAEVKS